MTDKVKKKIEFGVSRYAVKINIVSLYFDSTRCRSFDKLTLYENRWSDKGRRPDSIIEIISTVLRNAIYGFTLGVKIIRTCGKFSKMSNGKLLAYLSRWQFKEDKQATYPFQVSASTSGYSLMLKGRQASFWISIDCLKETRDTRIDKIEKKKARKEGDGPRRVKKMHLTRGEKRATVERVMRALPRF